MVIFCTERFKKSLTILAKNKRHYNCIHKRVKEDLLEIDECKSIKGSVLKQNSEKTLFKARFKSCNNNGRSYGFRAYILCDKSTSTAYCMEVYPKYGTANKDSLTPEEESSLLKEFKESKQNDELMQITWSLNDKQLIFSAQKAVEV